MNDSKLPHGYQSKSQVSLTKMSLEPCQISVTAFMCENAERFSRFLNTTLLKSQPIYPRILYKDGGVSLIALLLTESFHDVFLGIKKRDVKN